MAVEHIGSMTYIAGEALEPYRRVKNDSTAGQVVYADATDGDDWFAVTQPGPDGDAVASGDPVTLFLRSRGRTLKIECSAAVTANADLYPEDDGKISDDAGTIIIGRAAGSDTASGSGAVIEMHPGRLSLSDLDDHNHTASGDGGELTNPAVITAIVDTNGNELLKVTATGSAINEFTLANAASGSGPSLTASGGGTNVPVTLAQKGAAAIILGAATCSGLQLAADQPLLDSAGLELLKFTATGSAVNEVTIKNAATGGNPQICATGEADTGITFMNDQSEEILILDAIASAVNEITIKNAATGGNPQICATGEADTGITFMNDQSEEILILDAIASAVNEVTIANAATGVGPSIKATGETNVTLELAGKGTTGVVQVTSPLVHQTAQTAVTDTATLTIAQLLNKVIDGTPTAAANYTMPTAALLVAGITDCKVGDSFLFVINNKSGGANTITVVAGDGCTADGTLTVAQNVIRAFLIIVTNVTGSNEAYSVYGLGA